MSAVPAAGAPKPKDRRKKIQTCCIHFRCPSIHGSIVSVRSVNHLRHIFVHFQYCNNGESNNSVNFIIFDNGFLGFFSAFLLVSVCVFSVAASVYPYTWRRLNQPWKQSDAITAPWNRHMEILLWPDESCVHKYANIWMRHCENQSCTSS